MLLAELFLTVTFIGWLVCYRQFCWTEEKGKRGKESGPQYIDAVTLYIQKTISDESTFPTKFGKFIKKISSSTPVSRVMYSWATSFCGIYV